MVNLIKSRGEKELRELVKDKLLSYYAGTSDDNIDIEGAYGLQAHHCSSVYFFDIYKDRKKFKTLVVKVRKFNPSYHNNIEKDTLIEYGRLKFLAGLPNVNLAIPLCIGVFPEKGILITEKIEGDTLYRYLRQYSLMPLTPKRRKLLEDICFRSGMWLKTFHQVDYSKENEINFHRDMDEIRSIVAKFADWGIQPNAGKLILEKMETMAKATIGYKVPFAIKHGDFQPKNIIFYNKNVTALDLSSDAYAPVLKDISQFLSHLYIFNLKNLFSSFDQDVIDSISNKFLSGYYQGKFEQAPIAMFTLRKLMILIKFTFKRNTGYIKKYWLSRFFEKRIRDMLKGSLFNSV